MQKTKRLNTFWCVRSLFFAYSKRTAFSDLRSLLFFFAQKTQFFRVNVTSEHTKQLWPLSELLRGGEHFNQSKLSAIHIKRRSRKNSHGRRADWLTDETSGLSRVCLLAGCLTSQQQASVSQGRSVQRDADINKFRLFHVKCFCLSVFGLDFCFLFVPCKMLLFGWLFVVCGWSALFFFFIFVPCKMLLFGCCLCMVCAFGFYLFHVKCCCLVVVCVWSALLVSICSM